jgi:hypothetical protein
LPPPQGCLASLPKTKAGQPADGPAGSRSAARGGGTEGAEPGEGGQKSRNEGPTGPDKEGRSSGDQEVDLEGLYSVEGKGKVKVPTEAPELLAAAAVPSIGKKGAEQFGSQEQPFEWGNEQIWLGLTATERAAVVELLEEYRGIFAWSIYDLRDTAVEGVEFEVDFTDDKVIFAPRRRLSLYEYDLLKAYCEERVAAGLMNLQTEAAAGGKAPLCGADCHVPEEGCGGELDGEARLRRLPAAQRQICARQGPDADRRRVVR